MHIERSKPFARGVSELQYVGDVPGLAPAVDVGAAIPAAALAYVAWKAKGGKRYLFAGMAAYFGLKAVGKSPF